MTQPTLPNRRRPVFLRCPVCGTEFRCVSANHRWCSRECAQAKRGGWRALPKHQTAEKLKDRS
jgi:hypothetical protein